VKMMAFVLVAAFPAVLGLMTSTASTSRKPAPCAQGISAGRSIGGGNVLHGRVYINRAEEFGDGNHLFSGNVICTTAQGLFKFNVTIASKGISCKVKSGSSLQLGLVGKWLLRYRGGTSRCRINGGKMAWLKTPYGSLRTADPQFSITVRRKRTTIMVRHGVVRVFGRGKSVVVGPNQQTTVQRGAPPAAPTSAPAPSAEEQRDFRELAAPLPSGSVTTAAIQDGAVTLSKLAPEARTKAFSVTGGQFVLPGGPATLATLTLAAGAYAVTAKTVLANDSPGSVYVFCQLDAGKSMEDLSATMVGTNSARQTVTLGFTDTFSSPTTVVLTCRPTNPPTTTNVVGELSKIVAIKVGSESH
jgi:hypothetical protein